MSARTLTTAQRRRLDTLLAKAETHRDALETITDEVMDLLMADDDDGARCDRVEGFVTDAVWSSIGCDVAELCEKLDVALDPEGARFQITAAGRAALDGEHSA